MLGPFIRGVGWDPGRDRSGRRPGRHFGTGAPWAGRAGTVLLLASWLVIVFLFVLVTCSMGSTTDPGVVLGTFAPHLVVPRP